MSFLFPTLLTIGLPLVAVPILIHLINLRRQQRIKWAAMQFLLESQRRNRRWIMLKQLLLLLTRIGVITVLVLMLAHLVLRNEWLSLLGRGTTHHLVLLDDSYSMSDRWNETNALNEGKRAVQAIVDQASQQSDTQLVTLLRFSEAARLSAGAQPKVFAERINDTFRSRLESLLAGWESSETDVGPAEALKAIPRLPLADNEQSLIVYLVSDFRARQFSSATEIRKLLADLKEKEHVSQIHLVRCVKEARPNLEIKSLVPESGVRAAGVEMWMNVTVANYGDVPARGVTVQLEQDGDALPGLVLDDIPPRDEISHKFRVQFAGTGAHALTAAIPADAVSVDNRRYYACDLPAALPVLIVDGSTDGRGGHQLSLALAPGGNTHTGWQPHVELASFLADVDRLNQQAAVCLIDVPHLNDDEVAALENYVRNGGGVAFFVGANTDRTFYNDRLFKNSAGLFPAPLKLPTQLLDRAGETTPDVEVTQHPLFQVLAGRRNGFLPLLMVDYFYALQDDWLPPTDGSTKIIARLRNNAPLVIEKKFGKGRVIAQLTKLSSGETPLGRWTNWSLNPAFPVLANELASYLAVSHDVDPLLNIGDDLVVSTEEGKYESRFRFVLPGKPAATKSTDGEPGSAESAAGETVSAVGKRKVASLSRPEITIEATSANHRLTAKLENLTTSGIYEVQLQPTNGPLERREFAVNPPTSEGDLALTPPPDLTRQLAGVDYQMHDASDMALDSQQLAGFQMSDALLGGLIVLLLVEQVLAYLASYHIKPLRSQTR
ncbi:MAG TPA: BatA domain-containing protein [Lacipirellulaceae bacterium]|nr:BatA domain-containing protein [Lacipirellulaceae bacterium]